MTGWRWFDLADLSKWGAWPTILTLQVVLCRLYVTAAVALGAPNTLLTPRYRHTQRLLARGLEADAASAEMSRAGNATSTVTGTPQAVDSTASAVCASLVSMACCPDKPLPVKRSCGMWVSDHEKSKIEPKKGKLGQR